MEICSFFIHRNIDSINVALKNYMNFPIYLNSHSNLNLFKLRGRLNFSPYHIGYLDTNYKYKINCINEG